MKKIYLGKSNQIKVFPVPIIFPSGCVPTECAPTLLSWNGMRFSMIFGATQVEPVIPDTTKERNQTKRDPGFTPSAREGEVCSGIHLLIRFLLLWCWHCVVQFFFVTWVCTWHLWNCTIYISKIRIRIATKTPKPLVYADGFAHMKFCACLCMIFTGVTGINLFSSNCVKKTQNIYPYNNIFILMKVQVIVIFIIYQAYYIKYT